MQHAHIDPTPNRTQAADQRAYAETVIRAIGRDARLTVVLSPRAANEEIQGGTNGKTVILPVPTPETLRPWGGLADHESMHVLASGIGRANVRAALASMDPAAKRCLNLAEDVRVNALAAKRWTGSLGRLAATYQLAADQLRAAIERQEVSERCKAELYVLSAAQPFAAAAQAAALRDSGFEPTPELDRLAEYVRAQAEKHADAATMLAMRRAAENLRSTLDRLYPPDPQPPPPPQPPQPPKPPPGEGEPCDDPPEGEGRSPKGDPDDDDPDEDPENEGEGEGDPDDDAEEGDGPSDDDDDGPEEDSGPGGRGRSEDSGRPQPYDPWRKAAEEIARQGRAQDAQTPETALPLACRCDTNHWRRALTMGA